MRKFQLLCLMALTVGVPPWAGTAHAGGFQVNEHAAPALGRMGSVIATVDDASAVFFNPAVLTELEGTQFVAGVAFIRSDNKYRGVGVPAVNATGEVVTESIDNDIIPVPHAFASHALSSNFTLGFGLYFPYGLRLGWQNPEQFVGRTIVQEVDLRTIFLTPVVAYKVSDSVSVAAGVSFVPASVSLKQTIGAPDTGGVLFPSPPLSSEGTISLDGDAFGIGATAGIQVRLVEHLRIGFSYRSAIKLNFDGKADFDIPPEVPADNQAAFPDQDVSTEVTLPHSFSVGVGWVQDGWTLEASTELVLWNSNDELRIDFSTGLPAPSTIAPRDWHASPNFRLGGQYAFGDAVLRAGALLDLSPIPDETVDPTLPESDRIFLSAGGGYDFGLLRVDIAYWAGIGLGRTVGAGVSRTFAEGEYPSTVSHALLTSVGVQI